MFNYKERKERAKKSLFSAILFYGNYCFLRGMEEGEKIGDPKTKNKLRIKRYEKCEKIIETYIYIKHLK